MSRLVSSPPQQALDWGGNSRRHRLACLVRRSTLQRLPLRLRSTLLRLVQSVPQVVCLLSAKPSLAPSTYRYRNDCRDYPVRQLCAQVHDCVADTAKLQHRAHRREPSRACCQCCRTCVPAKQQVQGILQANPSAENFPR